jgi:hypothetical protein
MYVGKPYARIGPIRVGNDLVLLYEPIDQFLLPACFPALHELNRVRLGQSHLSSSGRYTVSKLFLNTRFFFRLRLVRRIVRKASGSLGPTQFNLHPCVPVFCSIISFF